MKKKVQWLFMAVAFAAVVLVAVWGSKQSDKSSPKIEQSEQVKIVLASALSMLTAPVWVAESQGYFKDNNIDIEIQEFNSGKASFSAMLEGKGPRISTVAQSPIIGNSFKRSDFAIISAMVTSYEDQKIVGRHDRGIEAPQNLAGKKIGLTKGSTAEFFLYKLLIHNGLDESSVEIVDFKPPKLPLALKEGQIDAISVWEPHALNAKNLLGDNASVLNSKRIYREDFYFVASREFLDAKPDAARRFLQAIAQADQYIIDNPQEAKQIVSQRLSIDLAQIDAIWDQFNFQIGLDQNTIFNLESEARWVMRRD